MSHPNPPQVVILAGGRGTRLGPLTVRTPKVLLPVAGRPFLALVLDYLDSQEVRAVHLCLGVGAGQVIRYLHDRPAGGPRVTTSVEGTPLGTAGCLRAAREHLEEEFAVLVGDSYTPVDLRALARDRRGCGAEAAMVVMRNRDWLVPSNVQVREGMVARYAKDQPPGTFEHVDYGIAFLRRHTLDRLPAHGPADLAELFHALIADGELAALEVSRRFYEIGSVEGYAELRRHLRLTLSGGGVR